MTHIVREPSTRVTCLFPRLMLAALVAGVLLVPARASHAAGTAEQICHKGRYSAWGQYSACQQKALAKLSVGGDFAKFQVAASKCRTKYTALWPKLQAKAPGSTCDTARFTDNGTTVTDNLTGLQWEKKTNDGTIHDKSNVYSWSASALLPAADGTAFTTILRTLNDGCFAGQCDWRLPTLSELQTIISGAYPCAADPCIDPVFGPTGAGAYWTATTDATDPGHAWNVDFHIAGINLKDKFFQDDIAVVRSGAFD